MLTLYRKIILLLLATGEMYIQDERQISEEKRTELMENADGNYDPCVYYFIAQ